MTWLPPSQNAFRIGPGAILWILCVEDNEDNVYLVKMRLEMIDGLDVTVARDGAEGVNLAATDPPDPFLGKADGLNSSTLSYSYASCRPDMATFANAFGFPASQHGLSLTKPMDLA